MVHNQYLKLRDLKLYFMKSNISKVSDFELYLFSTVLFATFKTRSKKKIRGTGLVPVQIPPEPVPDRNFGQVLVPVPVRIQFWSGPSRD